ncbi:MAG: LD-carboxypeptidase [Bacteroidales bacterium]|nr:LD-carboxypeptidase [Bacteroidales bacterium]
MCRNRTTFLWWTAGLEDRIKGLQNAIDDPDVRAIFMARGGYGAAQLLPFINWQGMYDSPKWIIGYSDVTVLHITLNNMGFLTIHGPMMRGFGKDATSMENLRKMLMGDPQSIEVPANSNCVKGTATGRLVGGNLSLVYAMGGTAFDLNTMDAILFIEDTGEANYSVDRMLLNLKQSGKLDKLKGVVVGQFIGNSQSVDLPLNEIIHQYLDPLGIPVVYAINSGHDVVNLPLMLGCNVTITVDDSAQRIDFAR